LKSLKKAASFTGLNNVKLDLTIEPEVDKGEHWKTEKSTFKRNGFDVRKIIQGVLKSG